MTPVSEIEFRLHWCKAGTYTAVSMSPAVLPDFLLLCIHKKVIPWQIQFLLYFIIIIVIIIIVIIIIIIIIDMVHS